MKLTKIALFVGAATIGLVGCGGGGGSAATTAQVTAIDNYLKLATVTLTCGDDKVQYTSTTNELGQANFTDPAIKMEECTTKVTHTDLTRDIDEPDTAWTGTLWAPKGKSVANAFTTLYVQYQLAGVDEATIIDQIIADLDPTGTLGLTADTMFADFGTNSGAKKVELLKLSNSLFHALDSVIKQVGANPAALKAALKNTSQIVGKQVSEQVNLAKNLGTNLDNVKIVVNVIVNADGSLKSSTTTTVDLPGKDGGTKPEPSTGTGTGTGTDGGGGTGA
ncbi:hypothetical protein K6Y31_04515 [Motilimonas cestriensis]|uniref:Lipoprotein n=1 Tax=Motilimonas cestriensis TaxID=2742685 RepID=A0ABS8W530_9GAMM|nr:hypothetical protein [Motilimonas cestriensis]MCE2594074.1 hypothetical protein [Motilimonas cestriensis]